MALYQIPKQTLTHLKLNVKGGPSQSVVSSLPVIFHTFLERLANPSPTYHMLRTPFIRPLLNKNASKLPIYNLLSPAHIPTPEQLDSDSPLQQELIEFFQEKQYGFIKDLSVEEDMPVWVYCMHRKRMLGPPQLVINEKYNAAISRAGKHAAAMHAVSVLSHQLSLMLQANSDPDFRVCTSRRPSDLDQSHEFNAYLRASFTDFQLEKRGNGWRLAGALQPSPLLSEGDPPSVGAEDAALFFKPRALTDSKMTQWGMAWEKPHWDERADLNFFTKDTTVPWHSIDDSREKAIQQEDGAIRIKVPRRSGRMIRFASPMTAWELSGDHSRSARPSSDSVLFGGVTEDSEETQRKQNEWIERLSAKDLGERLDDDGWKHSPSRTGIPQSYNQRGSPPRMRPATGTNMIRVVDKSTKPSVPSKSQFPAEVADSTKHRVSANADQLNSKRGTNSRHGRAPRDPVAKSPPRFSIDAVPHAGR